MIVWINGAFGAGKTQTACELRRRCPEAYIFDPENAGYYIRRNLPSSILLDDFQDYPIWRSMNYGMLSHIAASYAGIIIVPMTVVKPAYFAEIAGRLRDDGVDVRHFALCASRETLLRRLRSRGDSSRSWPARQIDRCVEGLRHEVFRHHLDTEHLSVAQAAETIAGMCGLRLLPDNRSALRKSADRAATKLRHIRFPW